MAYVDPTGITPLVSYRLIALDKQPGVWPIGIGEIPRRIIAKAVLAASRCDIQSSVGSVQLCGNQIAGCEAAVHAVKEMFKDEGTQGVLLVDASKERRAHMVGSCTHHLSWFGSGCHRHIAQFVIAMLAAVLEPKIRLSHRRDRVTFCL